VASPRHVAIIPRTGDELERLRVSLRHATMRVNDRVNPNSATLVLIEAILTCEDEPRRCLDLVFLPTCDVFDRYSQDADALGEALVQELKSIPAAGPLIVEGAGAREAGTSAPTRTESWVEGDSHISEWTRRQPWLARKYRSF